MIKITLPIVMPTVEIPRPAYIIEHQGYNRLLVYIPSRVFTREEAMRLIGELERAAALT